MRVLYLVPPAVVLWASFGDNTEISGLFATVAISAVACLSAKILAAQALIFAVLLPVTQALPALSI